MKLPYTHAMRGSGFWFLSQEDEYASFFVIKNINFFLSLNCVTTIYPFNLSVCIAVDSKWISYMHGLTCEDHEQLD